MEVTFKWQEQSRGQWQSRQRTVLAEEQKTILQIAQDAGIPIEAMCGGRARCGRCRVFLRGPAGEPTTDEQQLLSKEELLGNVRLACCVRPLDDVSVDIPTSQAELMRILTEGIGEAVLPESDITKIHLTVPKPRLGDTKGDRERLLGAASAHAVDVSLHAAKDLPEVLRKQAHEVTITSWQQKIIQVEDGNTASELYGMAVDIGTTTVVASLIDLHTGEEIAAAARLNGQAAYGADVISRIEYAASGSSQRLRLQKSIIDTLNEITEELEAKTGISSRRVIRAVLVGNTCMQHLALGISPTYIARAPYTPGFSRRMDVAAAQLGLGIYPEAVVTFLPNVAGFVGADTVGVVLATGMVNRPHRVLMIDVGTNGELVMSDRGRMVACSTAAGPAFEGTQITWGMRAGEGAIEVVQFDGDVELQIIGSTEARGLCGSGIIDLAAELLQVGIIDNTGRMLGRDETEALPDNLSRRIRAGESGNEFVVAWADETKEKEDIVLTQKDIRELQLAKGAVRAGTDILLKLLDLDITDIDELLLAGAFGNYLSKKSAVSIGLLPEIPLDKIRAVGNAARIGARACLISKTKLEEACYLPSVIEYVELSGRADFQEAFMDAMLFPLFNHDAKKEFVHKGPRRMRRVREKTEEAN